MNLVDVLQVLAIRDELVEGSGKGIRPFSECRESIPGDGTLYYDDTHPMLGYDGSVRYNVVAQSCCLEDHHDIISTYGVIAPDYNVTVAVVQTDGDNGLWIEMAVRAMRESEGDLFDDIFYCIEDGSCHTS